MRTLAYGLTDVGRRRENNQDQLLVDPQREVYAIADGMGGHAAGEVASHIAIQALAEHVNEDGQDESVPGDRLVAAFNEGNRRICDSVLVRGEWKGMGTTIVALLRHGDHVTIGHIGDSRAYVLRDGNLSQLTHDHSWVGEQVRMGLLTVEEAHRHPYRNIVTRAMGNRLELEVDVSTSEIHDGDVFLLCSDGLNTMLDDTEIAEVLRRHRSDPTATCRALIDEANARGGDDNVTVIVLSTST